MTQGYGQGVAVGDYDNDGHADLFVTRWRSYALYHNRGDGRFEDVTQRAGLAGDRDWPTSAAFADLDNDGDLDLYVCHYAAWDAENPRICYTFPPNQVLIGCNPREVEPRPDHVFRNDQGRFTDVTEAAGTLEHQGRGLGVVAADFDDDGRIDLFVANDQSANYLYHEPRRLPVRRDRLKPRGSPPMRREAIRRAWAWPAATSTATAGSTWP